MVIHTEGSPESCAESEDGSELLLNEKETSRLNCGGASESMHGALEDPLSLHSPGPAAAGLGEDSSGGTVQRKEPSSFTAFIAQPNTNLPEYGPGLEKPSVPCKGRTSTSSVVSAQSTG